MIKCARKIQIGERFDRLVVLREVEPGKGGRRMLCQCDCGKENITSYHSLIYKQVRSCGCLAKDKARETCIKRNSTHSMSKTRFYKTWKQMVKRGTTPSKNDIKNYGEHGVGLDDRWRKYENFYNDLYEGYLAHAAIHGEAETTIDRIDNYRGYYPSNVRWATPKEQSRNQRRVPRYEYQGKSLSMAEWSEIVGVDACTLKMRMRMGWTVERALTKPVKPSNRGKWDRKSRGYNQGPMAA